MLQYLLFMIEVILNLLNPTNGEILALTNNTAEIRFIKTVTFYKASHTLFGNVEAKYSVNPVKNKISDSHLGLPLVQNSIKHFNKGELHSNATIFSYFDE